MRNNKENNNIGMNYFYLRYKKKKGNKAIRQTIFSDILRMAGEEYFNICLNNYGEKTYLPFNRFYIKIKRYTFTESQIQKFVAMRKKNIDSRFNLEYFAKNKFQKLILVIDSDYTYNVGWYSFNVMKKLRKRLYEETLKNLNNFNEE